MLDALQLTLVSYSVWQGGKFHYLNSRRGNWQAVGAGVPVRDFSRRTKGERTGKKCLSHSLIGVTDPS